MYAQLKKSAHRCCAQPCCTACGSRSSGICQLQQVHSIRVACELGTMASSMLARVRSRSMPFWSCTGNLMHQWFCSVFCEYVEWAGTWHKYISDQYHNLGSKRSTAQSDYKQGAGASCVCGGHWISCHRTI